MAKDCHFFPSELVNFGEKTIGIAIFTNSPLFFFLWQKKKKSVCLMRCERDEEEEGRSGGGGEEMNF